jgi:hypothetical protein
MGGGNHAFAQMTCTQSDSGTVLRWPVAAFNNCLVGRLTVGSRGSTKVRAVQAVVQVGEATVAFDLRTRIVELRHYTRNATSWYVPCYNDGWFIGGT